MEIPANRIGTLQKRTHVLWLSAACLAVLPWQVQAQQERARQEELGRFVLEAGIVGGSSGCPRHYVGINGQVAGPVALYAMVEDSRCAGRAGPATRFGASVLVGRSSWLVRPALRAGVETSTNYVGVSGGASLTFGRRYGARFILQFDECGGTASERFQMGGYVSFQAPMRRSASGARGASRSSGTWPRAAVAARET